MATSMKTFAILFSLFVLIVGCARADYSRPGWGKPHSELVALSLGLSGNNLKIEVTNVSGITERVSRLGNDVFVVAYYLNDNGSLVVIAPDTDLFSSGGDIARDLAPNQKITRTVTLSPAELSEIATHPVVCRMIINDPAAKKSYHIEFPKQMVSASN